MYLGQPDSPMRFPIPWREYTALAVLVGAVMLVGLYPRPVYDAVDSGTSVIFEGTGQTAQVSSQR